MAIAKDEPVLILGDKKFIISELSPEAQYCVAQMNDIQADITNTSKILDRHRAAYSGFQVQLEKLVAEPEETGETDES
jgi:hypothetical protein